MSYKITSEKILQGVEKMNSFGPRYTGSKAHQLFIESLKSEIREMGFQVYSDPFYFKRWQAQKT